MKFTPATRKKIKLRLAISGPSGTGKTYTGLTIAKPFGKIAVIDTENRSASRYAEEVASFDVLEMAPPYHPDELIKALQVAHGQGYDVILVDSLSHFYFGPGGILDLVGQYAKKHRGNSHAAWGDVTPIYNRMVETLLRCPMHLICTMRAKADYLVTKDSDGKSVIEKVGMAPIMRDGLEYEFDVSLMLTRDHTAIVEKSRCLGLPVAIEHPGEDLGRMLLAWTEDGQSAADRLRSQIDDLEATLSGISEGHARYEFRSETLSTLTQAIEAKGGQPGHILGPVADGAPTLSTWGEKPLRVWLEWLKRQKESTNGQP